MKKFLLLLFIFFSFSCLKAQQYEYNVPFDSTLQAAYYSSGGPGCTGGPVSITLDSSLYNYVSGLQFMFICDSTTAPPWVNVHISPNDTIILNATNPQCAIPSGFPDFWGRVKLIGIPDSIGQAYPCSLEWVECACACPWIIIKAAPDSLTCFVNPFSSLKETGTSKEWTLYPNPAASELRIGNTSQVHVRLYDMYGRQVLEKEVSAGAAIDISALPQGFYTCMTKENGKQIFAKFIVER